MILLITVKLLLIIFNNNLIYNKILNNEYKQYGVRIKLISSRLFKYVYYYKKQRRRLRAVEFNNIFNNFLIISDLSRLLLPIKNKPRERVKEP